MSQSNEEQVKLAEAQLFAKLAADQGIDLNQLDDSQVQELWEFVFSKEAGDEEAPAEEAEEKEEAKKDDEEEKKEAAARDHAIKVAHAEEEARAHHLGQVMAHSYVAELDKIAAARAAAAEGTESEESKEASAMGKMMAARDAVKGAVGKAKGVAGAAASKGKEVGGKAVDFAKKHPKSVGGAAAGAAAAGAGGAYLASRKKQASGLSPIDELAVAHAVKIAADAGLDAEVAEARVNAVATLGLEESSKLASSVDSQVEIRALEYLEAAGYPVQWHDGSSESPQG
jgi:hypothetical protein